MKIQPRQQLLELWRALARYSADGQQWSWGARGERNSISDAEQLLCLLTPATEIVSFKLDLPDETAEDVLDALAPLGDSVEIPRRLLRVIAEYMAYYTDETGTPTFPGGNYFESADPRTEPTKQQLQLDVVDSYSMSVRLTLATLGFLRVFRGLLTRDDLIAEAEALEQVASVRLTAAMIGLLRSFAVNSFEAGSSAGQALLRTVNQDGVSSRQIADDLRQGLREIRAGLRAFTIGTVRPIELDNPNRLFECGWSWGVVRGAPAVQTAVALRQSDGVAEDAPYLYFTASALDGIRDLFSERTRVLGLLDDEQQRLSRTLQLRWDLTQSYWERIATFGGQRWPLEDLPWRTTDALESDYHSLLVTSIALQALSTRSGADAPLERVGRLLADLATRGRITRRPMAGDPAVALHSPGVKVSLVSTDDFGGPRLSWLITDFSPQLLRQSLRAAELLTDISLRAPMLELADRVWDHLVSRRLPDGPASGLWDRPEAVFTALRPGDDGPSWYYTERVVECLVAAAKLVERAPLRSDRLAGIAADLLAEAEHLFDKELLMASAEAGPAMGNALHTARATLRRARELLPVRPATASVLASDVLRELDRLAAARLSYRGLG